MCQYLGANFPLGVGHKRPLVGQFLGSGLTCFMAFKKLVMNIGDVWALTVFCWAVQIRSQGWSSIQPYSIFMVGTDTTMVG